MENQFLPEEQQFTSAAFWDNTIDFFKGAEEAMRSALSIPSEVTISTEQLVKALNMTMAPVINFANASAKVGLQLLRQMNNGHYVQPTLENWTQQQYFHHFFKEGHVIVGTAIDWENNKIYFPSNLARFGNNMSASREIIEGVTDTTLMHPISTTTFNPNCYLFSIKMPNASCEAYIKHVLKGGKNIPNIMHGEGSEDNQHSDTYIMALDSGFMLIGKYMKRENENPMYSCYTITSNLSRYTASQGLGQIVRQGDCGSDVDLAFYGDMWINESNIIFKAPISKKAAEQYEVLARSQGMDVKLYVTGRLNE